MGGTCRMHGEDEKYGYMSNFDYKTSTKDTVPNV